VRKRKRNSYERNFHFMGGYSWDEIAARIELQLDDSRYGSTSVSPLAYVVSFFMAVLFSGISSLAVTIIGMYI
jgi:hypothetical protein